MKLKTIKILVERIVPARSGKAYYVYTRNWEGWVPLWAVEDEGNNWIELNKDFAKSRSLS